MAFVPNPLIIPIGIMIGILITAPIGPVNVLCVQRAVERGFWGGVAAGLGTALGDGLIALFATFGVNALSGAVRHHRFAIQLIGGLVLMLFGIRLYLAKPRDFRDSGQSEREASLSDFVWDIPQTFFLTITNPGAVLGLTAIFGGVSSFVEIESHVDALTMVAAIMGGSITWWVLLSNFIGNIRHRIDLPMLRRINRIAGILLFAFGGVLLGEIAIKGTRII